MLGPALSKTRSAPTSLPIARASLRERAALPSPKVGKRLVAAGHKIDLDPAVTLGEGAERADRPFDFIRFGTNADFTLFAIAASKCVRHLNQQVRCTVPRERVTMHAHVPRGREFGPQALFRQIERVIPRKGCLILMREGDLESVSQGGRRFRRDRRDDQELSAVDGPRADEPRVAETQQPFVAVIIPRRVEGTDSAVRHRVRAQPRHPKRHTSAGRLVARQVEQPARADEGIDKSPEFSGRWPALGRGTKLSRRTKAGEPSQAQDNCEPVKHAKHSRWPSHRLQ